ncbi:hypothetical protein CMV_025558 [Castanea mollissima]|uniref:Uncharacterized protein n=1 Tax=Castanea mollissima TaxID=60419 RepID=A0A8J4VGN9_9ROSI|nr:hypothetical protein CMV_025558 [Castanea mollissima]
MVWYRSITVRHITKETSYWDTLVESQLRIMAKFEPGSEIYTDCEASAPTGADPIAMMEFYMKKAAPEEKFKQPKQSKDEMPPPTSLQGPDLLTASSKKGHHMGDYIPQEELEKFLAACNDAAA